MSAAEIGHRLVEQGKRRQSRRRQPDLGRLLVGPALLPEIPGLRTDLAQLTGLDELRAEWRMLADDVAGNAFCLLGQRWPGGPGEPDWHLDPVGGERWPAEAYCFDLSFRHGAAGGDVKFVWELGRLQYLQPLAALAALDDDADLRALVLTHVASWIDANPPFRGVGWASGIELALRVVSLLVVASCLGPAMPEDLRRSLLRCLAAHGYWLERFPSRHSSANNHRVAEAGGLYLLGALTPALGPADRWRAYGRSVLAAEVERQFLADGVGAEQSPTYAAFSLEWFLLCGLVARRLDEPFPAAYWARLQQAGDWLRALIDAGGNHPRIGDDDEGRVLASGWSEPDYVGGVLAGLAGATGRDALAPPRPRAHLRWALTGEPPAPVPASAGVRHFPDGGYTVVREGGGAGERLLVMDHGPLGFLSIAAHGHADALALWLHLGGQPVLVDAGTYLYHAGGAWRDHFRGTPAHNTLCVAGADSSAITGPFNWGARATVSLRELTEDPADWLVEAEHDGYLRRFGVRHRRRLAARSDSGFDVHDSLHGAGGVRPVEIGFLFAPGLDLREADGAWQVSEGGRPLLALRQAGPLAPRLERGGTSPDRGWYSAHFGGLEPASRLVFAGALAPGHPVVTSFQCLNG